ncbi:HTH-type transcriptional regulator LutR [Posidoniimonas corsicana]|uniref:HTH-type transcriptional regulator LutR n=1 Tax=Posidoniimonas corsicana TaxID=1938618 RepID=A0A5C5VCY9_9BACT|nr:GntR family transcriptional regulator [Posidoniimonas corsicana]TWT36468.1 HTH-type transcriptional regulator LutR [Posidoniimonas corsicana]
MSRLELSSTKVFRSQRYPSVQAIVEVDRDANRSLADKAGDLILGKIISGEFAAGHRLKSTELSEQLGMSRTPVTKAMAKLSSEGILAQPNNLQAIVTPEACEWLVQTHELRQLLEPAAAERAAGNVPDDVLDDLRTLARDAEESGGQLWEEAAKYFDFALHLSLADYCGNVPIKVSIRRCWKFKMLSYDLSEGCRSSLLQEYEQHLAILSAIARGHGKRARKEMANHLQAASVERFSERVI